MTPPSDAPTAAQRPSREHVRAVLREAGYNVTQDGVDRMRARWQALDVAAAAEIAGHRAE